MTILETTIHALHTTGDPQHALRAARDYILVDDVPAGELATHVSLTRSHLESKAEFVKRIAAAYFDAALKVST